MPHGAWEVPHQVSLLPSRQVAQRAVDDLSGSFFSPLVRGIKPVIIIAAEKLLCNLRQLAAAKISLQTWREAHRRLNHDEFMPTIEWFNRHMPREALSSVAGDHLVSGKISDCFEVMIRLAEAEIAELSRITGCSQWVEEVLLGLRAREDLSIDLFGSAADFTVPRSNDANASALELLWETLKCRVTDEFEEAAVAVFMNTERQPGDNGRPPTSGRPSTAESAGTSGRSSRYSTSRRRSVTPVNSEGTSSDQQQRRSSRELSSAQHSRARRPSIKLKRRLSTAVPVQEPGQVDVGL
ncbi:hypothetical protein FOZ60_016389 [Perkinsus olseni]|uniref:Uncharacterized protein n=1 Tax=Perkinsus olseni TaxID=32597 RepID=A0A7J6P5J1_PEROL|nr:hypothetical protein FOZ60_016389 [Perkinsus olseni]